MSYDQPMASDLIMSTGAAQITEGVQKPGRLVLSRENLSFSGIPGTEALYATEPWSISLSEIANVEIGSRGFGMKGGVARTGLGPGIVITSIEGATRTIAVKKATEWHRAIENARDQAPGAPVSGENILQNQEGMGDTGTESLEKSGLPPRFIISFVLAIIIWPVGLILALLDRGAARKYNAGSLALNTATIAIAAIEGIAVIVLMVR